MKPQLVAIGGPDKGRTFPLAEGQTLVIGRGQQSDTQIADPRMSRIHCRVALDGGRATVYCAGGSGGTRVSGQTIQEHSLRPGEVIEVGDTRLRFQLDDVHEHSTVSGIPSPVASAAGASAAKPLHELVGESMAHYHLDEVITAGMSGMVFKATDTQKSRTVAVKVLQPEVAGNEEQKQRFIRAMQTMMPIRHENIVQLYHAGKQGPYCWAAMEYVEGKSLAQIIDKIGVAGMLDWKEAFRVAVHIGQALAEAQAHKIIHRNVTPQNILQREKDKMVKLGDLMLAKATEGTQARQVTQPGQLIGDVPYMSPERTRDQAGVDGRSDIYGLGATVYALLTGHPPFASNSLPELITMVRNEPPRRPREVQLGIPELFEDVVMRMLAKRPEDRYQKPEEFLSDLRRIGKFQGVDV